MAMTESQKKYEKKRMQECKNYTIKYRLYLENELHENNRLKTYLEQSGQSANSYIKELIKRDLDGKGFMLESNMESNTDRDNTGSTDNTTILESHNDSVDI